MLLLCVCIRLQAQDFSVASFSVLEKDITAFMDPVYDLTNEPCALVRVVGSSDFAFSSPLGIVKRTDKTGEILLYLPNGSKSITIKHPQWGVMRDYRFTKPLVGKYTYELRLTRPQNKSVLFPLAPPTGLTVLFPLAVPTGLTRPRLPMQRSIMATVGIIQSDVTPGIMLLMMRRHGAYIHAQWNMHGSPDYSEDCEEDGRLADGSIPYYADETQRSSYMFTAGGSHRLSSLLTLYEGIGWGKTTTFWQMIDHATPTESVTSWVRNTHHSHEGIAFEVGTVLNFGNCSATIGVATIEAKAWSIHAGIGITL